MHALINDSRAHFPTSEHIYIWYIHSWSNVGQQPSQVVFHCHLLWMAWKVNEVPHPWPFNFKCCYSLRSGCGSSHYWIMSLTLISMHWPPCMLYKPRLLADHDDHRCNDRLLFDPLDTKRFFTSWVLFLQHGSCQGVSLLLSSALTICDVWSLTLDESRLMSCSAFCCDIVRTYQGEMLTRMWEVTDVRFVIRQCYASMSKK
jgi:hypothetical protein